MRSRANVRAHPIHPALIPFPFAFLLGALLFDLLGLLQQRQAFHATASHLTVAGIVSGLLAAVPGIVDYLYSVPPASSGKRRATRHGLFNVAALLLFGLSWLWRSDDSTPAPFTMICELAGGGLLAYSGWLGGTLVGRNMISVEHRYANAGKWKEDTFSPRPGQPLTVASSDELQDNQMKLLHIGTRRVVLARTSGHYTAFDDSCTHRGGSLADGVLIDGTVQCLWHGSQFDVRSGEVRCGPAKQKIATYEVRERDGRVMLVSPPE